MCLLGCLVHGSVYIVLVSDLFHYYYPFIIVDERDRFGAKMTKSLLREIESDRSATQIAVHSTTASIPGTRPPKSSRYIVAVSTFVL